MEEIISNSKQIYKCDVCNKIGNWTDEWQWFGSERDLDEDKPILYTCSNGCRNTIKGYEANRLLKLKRRKLSESV